jgi:hypothetical protein
MDDDYDTPWKDALTRYFPEFMAFYFPDAHRQIDWSAPHVFLEQELAQIARDAELGCRRVDKLVRVTEKDGASGWVFVHVDVQGHCDHAFAERMYVYNYRIYDRYHCQVASLAVLADGNTHWKPACFEYELFGCHVGIRFPVAKLNDYASQLEQLLQQPNVFGLVTAAHLLTQQTRGRDVERFAAKWRLTRMLYERNWDKQRVIDLFNVIDWMMHLPQQLQAELLDKVEELERDRGMPYVNSFERRGLERGLEQGLEKGLEQGLEQLSRLVELQMTKRFGALPREVGERLRHASPAQLQTWGEAVIDAPTLEQVFVPHQAGAAGSANHAPIFPGLPYHFAKPHEGP